MSGKNSKKLRRMVRLETEAKRFQIEIEVMTELKSWPFKERLAFAWRLVFPRKPKAAKL